MQIWMTENKEFLFYYASRQAPAKTAVLITHLDVNDPPGDFLTQEAINEWVDQNMPYEVGVVFSPEKSKINFRKWLKIHNNKGWCFWYDSVRFANEKDAATFRLFWG